MLRETPLHAWHVAHGAKMVDFGGWSMPLHYGSQMDEHTFVRQEAGLFDVSHMQVIDLHGENTRAFLRYLLANDVAKLTVPGKALYSCMLNPQAGVIDDLIVYFISDTHFRLVVNAGTAAKDIAWIQAQCAEFSQAPSVEVRSDVSLLAVQGPLAREIVWKAFGGIKAETENLKPFSAAFLGDGMIARTGYTGEDGFEIMLPDNKVVEAADQLMACGAHPCGLGSRDTLRLEAGMNLYGQDMDETTRPDASGLSWTLDLKSDRAFIGREALEAEKPEEQLVGLLLIGKGIMRAHQKVNTPYGVGEITSGTFSPTLRRSVALARLPHQVKIGDSVHVLIRDAEIEARIVKFPFVRNGKALIDVC
ncbi:MAG: glycine cleavage system aminomethyltransferase GcvT [Pseudomonadota bacterium]